MEIQNRQFVTIGQLYNEFDEIYHVYAKKHNLSDTALWLLYSVCNEDNRYTQSRLCAEWHCAPQTVNSALKSLEKQDYIRLEPSSDNQKSKLIVLTEKGRKIAQSIIVPLIHAEEKAIQQLTEKERTELFSLTKKYIEILRSEIN